MEKVFLVLLQSFHDGIFLKIFYRSEKANLLLWNFNNCLGIK